MKPSLCPILVITQLEQKNYQHHIDHKEKRKNNTLCTCVYANLNPKLFSLIYIKPRKQSLQYLALSQTIRQSGGSHHPLCSPHSPCLIN